MGVISKLLDFVFGGGRNVIRETAEVFRENAEAGAARANLRHSEAMAQFSGEFLGGRRGRFDRLMDAINRLPRPMMALGCLGLFVSAMVDPVWFAARMQGVALVPEPLWWLLGVVVSFYFGARHQMKGQEFQQVMALAMTQATVVHERLSAAETQTSESNAALADWRAHKSG